MSVPLTAADFLAAGDIEGLLAWRAAQHGDLRMDAGDDGGDDSTDETGGDGDNPDDDLDDATLAADLEDGDDDSTEGDLGFPANTKVEDMTADQKVAYWRNEAKKANARVKAATKKPAVQKTTSKTTEAKPKADPFRDAFVAKARTDALDAAVKAAVKPEMTKVVVDALRAKTSEIKFDVATLTADTAKAAALVEDYLKELPALKASTAPKLPGTTNGGQGTTATSTGKPRSLEEVMEARRLAGK